MGVTKYTQMIDNNGQQVSIQPDRVERFLGEGWTIVGQEQPKPEKKSRKRKSKKDKISADAQVTSTTSEDEVKLSGEETVSAEDEKPCISCDEPDHSYNECSEDNWTFSDDDLAKKEN